ncbi:RIP metalloprotease RseP [Methylobrevis albus]|uniref:Zinc metalloprotease n=1 Tax=Methylobrevis albus TaxID=2793297 RepID=A0A931I5J2_9HYPH|nr:RIP metalloprotease RseP [Methylobrevis albus]MBH0239673.1 RIP metalloprotease RseP [Methylobrevis albus]
MSIVEGLGSTVFGYLLPFLFVLTIVVFVHELGHFVVARLCGVKVRTFSIGFGPELFGFDDRHGTRWRLAAIPLGGYVKFIDDADASSAGGRADGAPFVDGEFRSKSVGRRAAIVAAGPIANFLLAIVIFALFFSLVGRSVLPPRVDEVMPDSPAAAAGFQVGDIITEVDGRPIDDFSELQRAVNASGNVTLAVSVDRGGERVVLSATPQWRDQTDQFGNVVRLAVLGITHNRENVEVVKLGPIDAVAAGVSETGYIISRTLGYLRNVVIGEEPADQIGGPIRVAQFSGQMASIGFVALINLAAMLSVSIGLINLFPVPLLDGGHLMFYAVEALRGRPLSERTQGIGFRIGMTIVLMLMVFATWNDITQLVSRG